MPFEGLHARQKRETGQSRMPEPQQAHWESVFHARHPSETRSAGNGYSRYQRRTSTSFVRVVRKPTSGQNNNRVRLSHERNMVRESEVKEASKYISSSGEGNAPAKRKLHLVQKPRQACRDLSESRNGRARVVNKNPPLDQTALLMSAHHVATDLHSHVCKHKHQPHQRPSSVTTQCRHQHKQMTP